MTQDTNTAIQYLETLISAIKTRGVTAGTLKIQVENEMTKLEMDPDYDHQGYEPTGRTNVEMTWVWEVPIRPAIEIKEEFPNLVRLDRGG